MLASTFSITEIISVCDFDSIRSIFLIFFVCLFKSDKSQYLLLLFGSILSFDEYFSQLTYNAILLAYKLSRGINIYRKWSLFRELLSVYVPCITWPNSKNNQNTNTKNNMFIQHAVL